MLEHYFIRESGQRVPIHKMTDKEIAEVLIDGVEIACSDGLRCSPNDILERLKREQLIRARGL